jgi:integrase/recombinase XerD
MNLVKACKKFIDYCTVDRQLSQNTLLAYSSDLLDFRRWLTARKAVKAITTNIVRAYLESLVRRKLAASTVRRRLLCLRAFFRYLNDNGDAADPFLGWRLRLPRPLRLPRSLSRNEATSLLRAARRGMARSPLPELARRTEMRLMIATGIRISELCNIQVEDISRDAFRLQIHGKGTRERVVYVTDRSLRAELRKLASVRKKECGSSGPLFVNRHGRRLRPDSVRLPLSRFAGIAGLHRRVTPHMLRHTAATLLLERGADIRIVQRLLGHSSVATTEIYTYVSDVTLRSALKRANVLGSLAR